jgi:hypothetical protein
MRGGQWRKDEGKRIKDELESPDRRKDTPKGERIKDEG